MDDQKPHIIKSDEALELIEESLEEVEEAIDELEEEVEADTE